MRPAFSISADGQDATAVLRDRLLKLSITDAAGRDSDQLEVVFDNRAPPIALPRRGAVLACSLGWGGAALTPMGRFTVDEVVIDAVAATLSARAKAADMRASLKAQRRESHRSLTVGQLVAKIASRNGLAPAVAPEFADLAVPHLDQTNESDLNLLTRLARELGATAAPKNGKLVFTGRASGKSAGGKPMPRLRLTLGDFTALQVTIAERESHGSVEARYRDPESGRIETERAGSGEPRRTLRHLQRDKSAAAAVARASLARAQRESRKLTGATLGRPELVAEAALQLSECGEGVDGAWAVTQVRHDLDWTSGGFTTSIEADDGSASTEAG